MAKIISFDTISIEMPEINPLLIKKWITLLIEAEKKEIGEINYHFCDDATILEKNKLYLQHDYYTDVITFDLSVGDMISGDILISLDTVKSNAEKFKQDFHDELHRVIIHGVLHLLAYNDKEESEAKLMRKKEDEALELLKSIENEPKI